MSGGRAVAVLPARYASTRLPGKPLLADTGKPLIQHTWEAVRRARRIDAVVVATDDERIAEAARGFGAEVVMTSADHPSGSDRVDEVASLPAFADAELLVNVQGDEPEVDPAALDRLVDRLDADAERREQLATLARPFAADERDAYLSPHAVKVVFDAVGRALYFSRSPIPHGDDPLGAHLHVGVYAWRRDALRAFSSAEPTALERRERLEQLRALELGMTLGVVVVDDSALGIDTPSDYARFVERVRATTARGNA